MAQGEVGTLEESPLVRPFVECLSQQTAEGAVSKGVDEITTRVVFLVPFRRIAHAVGDTLAYNSLVELSLSQFEKETA